eukprot:4372253-Amphidinium_carterae.1
MKAHLKQTDVDSGRVTADDFRGNQQADLLANQCTALHGPLEPDPVWLTWQDFAMKVYHFWRLVGPQLRERPEEQPSVKLRRNDQSLTLLLQPGCEIQMRPFNLENTSVS